MTAPNEGQLPMIHRDCLLKNLNEVKQAVADYYLGDLEEWMRDKENVNVFPQIPKGWSAVTINSRNQITNQVDADTPRAAVLALRQKMEGEA